MKNTTGQKSYDVGCPGFSSHMISNKYFIKIMGFNNTDICPTVVNYIFKFMCHIPCTASNSLSCPALGC